MKNSKLSKKMKIIIGTISTVIGLSSILLAYFFSGSLGKAWTYVINIVGAIILFIGISFIYSLIKKGENKLNTKQMTLIALMSSITVILYYFVKFNLPFFPPWLDIQVSEIPALITCRRA